MLGYPNVASQGMATSGGKGRSIAQRHPGATMNSGKGRILSMQTDAMRIGPAKMIAPSGRGASLNQPMPSAGAIVRSAASTGGPTAPAGGGSGAGIRRFSYAGGLKSPGQFSG